MYNKKYNNNRPNDRLNDHVDKFGVKPILKVGTEGEYEIFIKSFPEVRKKLCYYTIHTDYNEIKNLIENNTEPNSLEEPINYDFDRNDKLYEEVLGRIDERKEWYNNTGNGTKKEKLLNTFDYLYNHMRCGIYMSIRDNKIKYFVVFANPNYRNNWSQYITFEDGLSKEEYYKLKEKKYYRHENILPIDRWYSGGRLLDNENNRDGTIWGQHSLIHILSMFNETLACRKIKDSDFFINKRDYALLKMNLEESYHRMFPSPTPLIPEKYRNIGFVPIYSFFSSGKFSDIMIPCYDDWSGVDGQIIITTNDKPSSGHSDVNYNKFSGVKWEEKIPTAFFRGSGTGAAKLEKNQRFMLAKLSFELNDKSVLDAGVTTFNVRDKKDDFEDPVTFTKHDKIGFPLSDFVPMNKQMMMKYILCVEGHSFVSRFNFLFKMKNLVMLVDPLDRDCHEVWSTPFFKQDEDYILVKKDMSDLIEKIYWCRENDDICKQISINGYNKYMKYCSKTPLIDYLQYAINEGF